MHLYVLHPIIWRTLHSPQTHKSYKLKSQNRLQLTAEHTFCRQHCARACPRACSRSQNFFSPRCSVCVCDNDYMWTSSATQTFPRPIQNQFTLFKQKKNIFLFTFVAFLWSTLADRWSVVVVPFVDWAYNLFGECDIREYVSRIFSFSFPFRAAKQIVISFNVFWAKRARPMMTKFPSKWIAFASDELDKREENCAQIFTPNDL